MAPPRAQQAIAVEERACQAADPEAVLVSICKAPKDDGWTEFQKLYAFAWLVMAFGVPYVREALGVS